MTGTIRVMLIDDHPVVRAGLRSILDSFTDIEVVAEAPDGRGITGETLRELGVNVVVSDIQMPHMDGITLTKQLAQDPPAHRC